MSTCCKIDEARAIYQHQHNAAVVETFSLEDHQLVLWRIRKLEGWINFTESEFAKIGRDFVT
jgi:hypothetical protein